MYQTDFKTHRPISVALWIISAKANNNNKLAKTLIWDSMYSFISNPNACTYWIIITITKQEISPALAVVLKPTQCLGDSLRSHRSAASRAHTPELNHCSIQTWWTPTLLSICDICITIKFCPHDDIMTWKHFPYHWRETIGHCWITLTNGQLYRTLSFSLSAWTSCGIKANCWWFGTPWRSCNIRNCIDAKTAFVTCTKVCNNVTAMNQIRAKYIFPSNFNDEKQGKSEGHRPSNLTETGFKSSIFQPAWPWNLMYDLKNI